MDGRIAGEPLKEAKAPENVVYRLYLAGGLDSLRLPWSAGLLILGLSLVARYSCLPRHSDLADWAGLPVTAVGALLVAVFATRWLGSRQGLLVGIIMATSLWACGGPGPTAADRLGSIAVWAAMATFAVANVPGRVTPDDRHRASALFWIALGVTILLAGATGTCFVLAACGLYLLASQDSKGLRFLLNPWGLAFIAVVVAGCLGAVSLGGLSASPALAGCAWALSSAATEPASLMALARALLVAALPWAPLGLLAALVGIREGYYFTAFWRLLVCWAVGPAVLLAAGLYRQTPHLTVLLPPLAILSAIGLDNVLCWLRRRAALRRTCARATP